MPQTITEKAARLATGRLKSDLKSFDFLTVLLLMETLLPILLKLFARRSSAEVRQLARDVQEPSWYQIRLRLLRARIRMEFERKILAHRDSKALLDLDDDGGFFYATTSAVVDLGEEDVAALIQEAGIR